MPMLSLVAVIITALLLSCVATATATAAAAAITSSDKSSSFAVVGYLPEWRYGGANFEK